MSEKNLWPKMKVTRTTRSNPDWWKSEVDSVRGGLVITVYRRDRKLCEETASAIVALGNQPKKARKK
jgi:hypothetical protein